MGPPTQVLAPNCLFILEAQVTICQRTMHYTYMKPKSSYAFGFGFGTVLPVTFVCFGIKG